MDGYAESNQAGVELLYVGTAVSMQGEMLVSRRIAVLRPLFPNPPRTFECKREHARVRIGDGPTRHGRRARLHGDSTGAEQGQDGIIKGDRAVRVGYGEIEMAQGSTDHDALLYETEPRSPRHRPQT